MYQPDPDLYRQQYAELVTARAQERLATRLLRTERRLRSTARRSAAQRRKLLPTFVAARRTWSAQH